MGQAKRKIEMMSLRDKRFIHLLCCISKRFDEKAALAIARKGKWIHFGPSGYHSNVNINPKFC